ncbi:hypothetical protein AAC691_15470 [Nguyenibacter vanlangensis]|uniref:Uncharacterized protein n=1 Tax=Nguyenibacter vanlangensis TaxID=1216886 RepID=A0ABZ3D1V7_9PROT
MIKIDINTVDANLLADIAGDEAQFQAFEADRYQIVFSDDMQRGGIVLVGSGSSGVTEWTDATGPADVLARFLADDMHP